MQLSVKNLTKAYGKSKVIDNFSMETGPGIYRIAGPSGSGKTTLLRVILGLEGCDSGEVRATSDDGSALSTAALFQEDRLLEHLSAEENLKFTAGKAFDREKAALLLEKLGLDLADPKPAGQYSGGMKRRLALARALLSGADLLALDEPLTGLDEGNVKGAMEAIEEYGKNHIVLLVSHIER